MKKLLLLLAVLPLTALAEGEPVTTPAPTEFASLTCPQPVSRGCNVSPYGLWGATCTQEDYVKNLPCFDISYQQKEQYDQIYNSNYQ